MIITLPTLPTRSDSALSGRVDVPVTPSFILHEKAAEYYWQGSECLSIKTFFSGRALYTLGQGYCAVDDTTYLIVNHKQPYTIAIENDTPIESFCLFFAPGFAEEVHRSFTTQPERLLDELTATRGVPLHFFERTYPHDDVVSPALFQLRAAIGAREYEHIWLQEQFHGLMLGMLQAQHMLWQEIDALPAVRAATREELYRRLHLARDYAAALFDFPLTLDELAAVASLSPNHFLRTFKHLFRQTPHQYLTGLRLMRAQHLLRSTDCSVTDICFSLGFASVGSFSWLFRKKVGCSPSTYRAQKGDFGEA